MFDREDADHECEMQRERQTTQTDRQTDGRTNGQMDGIAIVYNISRLRST